MLFRGSMGTVALALSFGVAVTETRALDDAKYPEIRGAAIRDAVPQVRATEGG
jgi:hypothetical protein